MAAYDFSQLIADMDSYGVSTILLPFLLVFAIVYAILEKIQIFERKAINVVIAFVMAFFVATNLHIVSIIRQSLPNVAVVLVAILCVILIIGIFGFRLDISQSGIGGLIAFLAFAVVLYIFGDAAGWWGFNMPWPFSALTDPSIRPMVIVIAVFFLLIWYITKEDEPSGLGPGIANVLDQFRRMLTK